MRLWIPALILLISCQSKPSKSIQIKKSSDSLYLQDTAVYVSDDMDQEEDQQTFFVIQDSIEFNISPLGNYSKHTMSLQQKRLDFGLQLDTLDTDSTLKKIFLKEVGHYLEKSIVNDLIPFWYGTGWDFEGHTNVPGQGKVACGYFVSTVLKHAGFNLNRYRLAQQYSSKGCEILQHGASKIYRGLQLEVFLEQFKKDFEDGLYQVGLDCHVGFLYLKQGTVFFIHSNYLGSQYVEIEYARYADALRNNSAYHIAEISNNQILIEKWVKGEEIKIM